MNRRLVVLIAVALFLVVLGLPTLVQLLADWWWFQSVGYQSVFLKVIGSRIALGLVVGLVALAFLYANLRYAQRGLVPHPVLWRPNPETPAVNLTVMLRRLAAPAALILAFLFGTSSSTAWLTILSFLSRTPFDLADPIFQRDLGYYFFTLPAARLALGILIGLAIVSLIIVVPLYAVRGDLLFQRRLTVEPSAQMHIASLIALILAAAGVNLYLVRIPSLLYSSPEARFFGASYADLAARLPFLRVLGVVALLGAAAVIWGARRRRLVRNLLIAVGAYAGVSAVTALYATVLHRFVVLPNELARETPQLRHHIAATRKAWGLDRVEVRDLSGEAHLTLADIRANSGTIKNVRLWDRDPLLQTFGQLQEIRTYYDFISVD
ncbi:MAG: UPF0182 family protein, partial [Gemmatimonadetes bacterium]|nr:UPF0182 family protein [Gemmatimonadota bacterium]